MKQGLSSRHIDNMRIAPSHHGISRTKANGHTQCGILLRHQSMAFLSTTNAHKLRMEVQNCFLL